MRAFAVIAVLLAHAQVPLASGGGVGVDVFFVLSGFLITSLLINEFTRTRTISLRNFYIRRARRLLPALVAVCVFSFVAFAIVRPPATDATLLGIGASLIYIASWLRAFEVSDLGWFGHTWSLSIEEHFYLVWPLAVLLVCRRRMDRLRFWVLTIFVVSVLYRVAFLVAGASSARLNDSPDLRAEQLLAGCALAVLLDGYRPRAGSWWVKIWPALVAVSALDLARVVMFHEHFAAHWYMQGSSLIAVESAVIIGYLAVMERSWLTRFLSLRSFVWIGRRSYAVYLWHLPLLGLFALEGHPTSERAVARAVALALTFVAAWASFRWVEFPLYRRRVEEEPPAAKAATVESETRRLETSNVDRNA